MQWIDVPRAPVNSEEGRGSIKSTKFILLKNQENLVDEEPARLKEPLAVNRRLATVYILRDGLKTLWQYSYPKCAETWFRR